MAARLSGRLPPGDGMTMNSGLYRIELKGLTGLGGSTSGRLAAVKYLRSAFVWLPVALVAGFGAWMLVSGYSSDTAESEPVRLAAAVETEPVQPFAPGISPNEPWLNPAGTPIDSAAPAATSPLDGLRISSQSWRRGGLGSKALVTFTLRNGNDYAVKDVEIACAFTRRDGSHLTDRKRLIPDTVNMKSQKTFARLHVGFVNVHADKAKCSLLTANRI
jgi:hypothetical protein